MDYRQVPVEYDPFAQDAALPPAEPAAMVPPAGEPGLTDLPAPPAPAPTAPAPAAPAKGFKQTPVDYDPFAPVYNPADDTAVTRGFKVGREGGTKAFKAVADMHRISSLPPDQQVAELLKPTEQDPAAAQMQVPGVEKIGGVNDFLTYVGENVGQMAGSMFSAAETGGLAGAGVGALAGGAAGATAMGVGAIPGAVAGSVAGGTYGTAGAFVAQGIGGMYQDLLSDEGVRKGLQDGTVTPEQIFNWSVGAGSLIGMIDIIPEARLAEKFGLIGHLGKDQVKKTVLKALTKGALHQAGTEGGTEALQGAISELGQAVVGGDVNASQRALSVINQGLAGAIGGAGPGAAGGVVENARIPTQPGVDTPAPAADVGQPTPGGNGVSAPPPAGASATTPPPADAALAAPGAVTVVPKGAVDPAIEATVASAAPDAQSAPRPSPGVVPTAGPYPAVASPGADEENVYDPAIADETDADLAALGKAQDAIKEMLKAREVAASSTAATPPNADINAALAPAPQQTAQSTPQVLPPQSPPAALPALGPEPIGTAGAASRQPAAPVEGTPSAPTPFDNGLVAPAPTIQPAAQEPVGAVSPAPSVPAQPVASFAPAPQPAAAPLKLSPVARALADRVRVELQTDPLQETPGFFDAVNQAAAEQVANLPRGTAPARAVEQRFADTIAAVRTRLGQSEAEQVAREAQIAEAQQQRAIETAKAKRLAGTPQEKARTGKTKTKTAEEILAESEQTTLRAAKASPGDKDLADFAGLYEQRKALKNEPGSHQEKASRRKTLTTMMGEAQARRAERIGRKETPAPAATEVKPGLTAEEVQTANEAKDAARKAAAITKAKERGAKLDPAAKAAIASVTEPSWDRIPTMPRLAIAARDYVKNVIDAVTTALKGAGEQLGSRIDRNHSPAENLAIFGKQLLAGQHPGMDPSQFVTAKLLVDGGHMDDFFNLATNETLGGYQLENRGTAPEGQGGAFDEGANQFLDIEQRPLSFQQRTTGEVMSLSGIKRSTGGEVLRDAVAAVRKQTGVRGFSRIITRMHAKMLRHLVGDVPVVFASSDDIARMRAGRRVVAFYSNPSDKARFTTSDPAVYINNDEWVAAGPAWRAHIILHELTHAATAFAVNNNIRGTAAIVTRIRSRLRQHMESGMWPRDTSKIYAFKNDHEFLAEAFSNPEFQDLLASIEAPDSLAEEIRGITARTTKPTWWQAFVAAVQNAIGMFDFLAGNTRTTNYLDLIVSAHPIAMQSLQEQNEAAQWQLQAPSRFNSLAAKLQEKRQAAASHAFDVLPMSFDVLDGLDAVKGKAGFRWYNRASRWLSTRLASTTEMIRSTERLFGGADNPFKALAEEFLSGRNQREKYRKVGDEISVDLAAFKKAHAAAFAEFADIAYEATLSSVDPSQPLSAPSNRHVSKKGLLDNHRRASHAALAPRWAALTPEAKSLWDRMATHYAAQEELRLGKLVRNIVNAAVGKYDVKLPAGETTQSVVDWVMNGEVDRAAPVDPANPATGERTARDEALHKALGKTAETLAGTRGMRRIKGTYIPLTRWGKYFFTAVHKVQVPAGAILDPSAKDKNVLIFADKQDLNAYTGSTDEQIDSVQSRYVDPTTGARVTSKDANAQQIFTVTVQNRTLLMDDNQAALARQREDYLGPGFDTPSEVALIDTIMHGSQTVLPQQLNRLVNNVRQSTVGNVTVGQQANINAITDAYIRQLAGSRAAHRRLKRRNVAGFSKDLVQATLSSNHVMSGHLTQLDRAPKMAELDDALNAYVEAGRKGQYPSSTAGTDTLWRQEYVRELRHRIQAITARNDEAFGGRAANLTMDLSFMTHLFSPAYTIINLMQPLSTTHPMYAAEFGDGATTREMIRAYWDLGARKTLVRGIKETVRETQKVFSAAHKQFRHHDATRALGAGIEHGAVFQQAMDKLEQLGLGSSSGIETADIHEIGRSKLEQGVGRAVRVARALPEAAEAINRYTTLLAGVRLAKRKGMTDAQAVDFAVTSVEKSQGGYAAENNPAFMSNKWLRVPLQFKKYPLMYGQLFYGNLARALNTSNDRQTRVVAAKTVIRLSAMTIALAGTAGLPFMEIARGLLLAASAFGLNDDDWESWENGLQDWYRGAIEWATGNKEFAVGGAEVIARGASRMLSFDTSSRLGNDSMVMFGDPKTLDEQGTYAWLFGMAIGAPGGMATDVIKGIHNREITKAVPLPKFMRDAMKGYGQFMEGTKTAAGRQVADPVSGLEAFWQGLGFRPASSARQWEVGGSGAESKAKKVLMTERTKVMGSWSNAAPGDRQKIWRTEIRAWNRDHKSKAEKIEYGDLQRSLARRKALAKSQ